MNKITQNYVYLYDRTEFKYLKEHNQMYDSK